MKACVKDCCRINGFLNNKDHDRCLAGIDPDRSIVVVRPRGDDENWQTVRYKKKGRKSRKWTGAS